MSTTRAIILVVASTSIDSDCLPAPIVVGVLVPVVESTRLLDDEKAVQEVAATVVIVVAVVMVVADAVVAIIVGLDSVS
jgi:hypothetical protein